MILHAWYPKNYDDKVSFRDKYVIDEICDFSVHPDTHGRHFTRKCPDGITRDFIDTSDIKFKLFDDSDNLLMEDEGDPSNTKVINRP